MADSTAKRELEDTNTDNLSQKVKRAKTDSDNGKGETGQELEPENLLSGFKTSEVLRESPREKSIFIHGKVTLEFANFAVSMCLV